MDLFSLLKKGGKPSSPVKQHFPGCIELHGSRPAYNADANPSKLASIPVTEVTAVKSDPIRSRGKRVAANDAVRCYAVKNFIRVLGSSGDQRTLLRGHTAPVVDLVVRCRPFRCFGIIFLGCLADFIEYHHDCYQFQSSLCRHCRLVPRYFETNFCLIRGQLFAPAVLEP